MFKSNQNYPPARNSQEVNTEPNPQLAIKAIDQLLEAHTVEEYMTALDEWYSHYMVEDEVYDKATKKDYTSKWLGLKNLLGALLDYEVQRTLEFQ